MATSFWHEIGSELAPFEGRLGTTWRIALVCALATLVFMTYQIPLVAIGCYLILFVMKPDPGETTLMAMAICVLVSIVVVLLVFLTRLSIDVPLWRMVIIALSSFLFLYLGAASKLGPVGSIIALVIAFVMTLLGDAPFGEVATRGILYAWLMALVPMGLIILCNVAFGRSVPRLLRRTIAHRLRTVAKVLQGTQSKEAVWPLLREGHAQVESYLTYVGLFHGISKKGHVRLSAAGERSYALLLQVSELPQDALQGNDAVRIAQVCLTLAQALEKNDDATWPVQDVGVSAVLQPVVDTLAQLYQPVPKGAGPPSGFFYTDAFTNPDYQRFALKTTLAAVLAYTIYTALDWQDIHTAMITCYVAALGSTGETLHKLTLRIIGCLIGAAMGVLSILFLMPLMTSIGQLMLLVFVGIMVAGWVSSGSERSAYAGVQIGLAFLLTVLQGFGPDVEMSVALDRVVGILLGNAILYLVFTRIWPVGAMASARLRLMSVFERLAWFGSHDKTGSLLTPSWAARLLADLNVVREQLARVQFEPKRLRPDAMELARFKQDLGQIEQLVVHMAASSWPASGRMVRWQEEIEQMRQKTMAQPA